jgi:hypothetical protein
MLAVLTALATQAGCASLSGLSGTEGDGGTGDGGHRDAAASLDAGKDARQKGQGDATADADGRGPGDASKDHAQLDAPSHTDAGGTPDAEKRDAREAGAQDAGVDVACTPTVPPDSGAAPTCPAAEAGSCAPVPLGGFAPTFVPSRVMRGACTTAQISNLISTCFGPSSSQSACQMLLASADDQVCNGCMITGNTAPAWGPLVYHATSGYYIPNVGGCIDVLAPCERPCAQAVQGKFECAFAACESACLNDVGDFNTCTAVAGGCECAPEIEAYVACENALAVGPQATCFFDANEFLTAAQTFGELFCGSGADGGLADGG